MLEKTERTVSANKYIDALREITDSGQEVSLTICGNSMMPFLIHGRDQILFRKLEKDPVKGDMVFFQREGGRYIMHRICRVAPEGYYIVGDAQCDIEGPVKREQIFAIVTAARRKGKWIKKGSFWWEFFARVWIWMIPVRHPVMRLYAIIMRKDRKKQE